MLTSLMTFLLLLLGMLGVPLTHVLVCGVFSCALRLEKRFSTGDSLNPYAAAFTIDQGGLFAVAFAWVGTGMSITDSVRPTVKISFQASCTGVFHWACRFLESGADGGLSC